MTYDDYGEPLDAKPPPRTLKEWILFVFIVLPLCIFIIPVGILLMVVVKISEIRRR